MPALNAHRTFWHWYQRFMALPGLVILGIAVHGLFGRLGLAVILSIAAIMVVPMCCFILGSNADDTAEQVERQIADAEHPAPSFPVTNQGV